MRVLPNAVVLSSLLIGAVAVAQPAVSGSGAARAGAGATAAGAPSTPSTDLASVKTEDMPTAVRLRRLEQKTQALKERAWQLKARVQMLKEQTLGGGVGAQAVISHNDQMGSSFRVTKLIYSLDGTQVFARSDEAGESMFKTKSYDIFAGPIAPGNHTLQITATYRGHGYGVFEYLSKFNFTARGNASFSTGEGKMSRVECKGYEKGGASTPMEKRPAIECKVTDVAGDKPSEAAAPAAAPATAPAAGQGK